MKRDMDLIRSILLWVEARPEGHNIGWQLQIEGHTSEEVGFHVHLLGQAGLLLVDDETMSESTSPCASPVSLTWAGYEFLESADDTLWAKAKSKVIAPAGGIAFTLLLEWLKAEGRARLGLTP
jgi:hypothetical protein